MEMPSEMQYPVSEELLRLEREERRFQREMNETVYLSWRQLLRRVRPGRRYRIAYFGEPRLHGGDEVLKLAHDTLDERCCTFIDEVRPVDRDYEIPVEDFWRRHIDPVSGRMLVDGHDEDYWDLSYFVGTAGEDEPGEGEADGILQLFGLSVKSLAEEAIARRCVETGVKDPGAAAEAEWAVRRTVARTLTGEEAGDRIMRQLLVLARGRAAEAFDRACGMARIRRAGVDLEAHGEYRYLQAFYELGVKPPAHAEAADIIIGMLGARANSSSDSPPGVMCRKRVRGASQALFVIDAVGLSVEED